MRGAVTIVYDGDGNRVSETVGGVTTKYLVDLLNPTGYSQVVDELVNGDLLPSFRTKLSMISAKERGRVYVEESAHGSEDDRGAEAARGVVAGA